MRYVFYDIEIFRAVLQAVREMEREGIFLR